MLPNIITKLLPPQETACIARRLCIYTLNMILHVTCYNSTTVTNQYYGRWRDSDSVKFGPYLVIAIPTT